MDVYETFCPLRGDKCDHECEWMIAGTGCSAYHIALNMERIAQALEDIVSGPNEEEYV